MTKEKKNTAGPTSIQGRTFAVWQGGLILLLVFLAYFPAMRGAFVWDDDSWTTKIIGLLRDTSGLRSIWFQPTAMQQYYPLSGTTFWLEYHLWGLNPLGYHLINILLHATAAILLWQVLRQLRIGGAWLAALLFALHPVCVESVAWITELKNVFSLVLYFGALLAYGRYAPWVTRTGETARVPDSSRGACHPLLFYGLAFVLFLGALLAKTTTFSLPAVVLLIGWWQRGQIQWRADVLPTLPFFVVALGLCAVTAWVEKYHVGAEGTDFAMTFPQRCLIAGHVFWFYLGKLFWPAHLCFVYPGWQPNPGLWWQWLYPVTALGALFALWLARGRIGRGPVTALFFYVGTLFPVLGFMNAYGMRFSFVWDHWVYLSAVGIITLAAALVVRAAETLRMPAVVYGFAGIVLPVLAFLTWQQAGMYKDTETLWRTTLARNPDCWMAHNNLGFLLGDEGHTEEAIEHYHKALQVKPDYCDALFNLANALKTQRHFNEAIEYYRKGLQIDPNNYTVQYNLGNTLKAQGHFDEAVEHYREALQIKPDYCEALNNLGTTLKAQGRPDEAIECYRKALQVKPDNCEALNNLGAASADKGRFDEAIKSYHTSLQINPNSPGALNNLAWVLATGPRAEFRDGPQAVQLAERACELTHYGNPLFIGTLAAAYAESGRFPEAATAAEKAEHLAADAGMAEVAAKNRQLLELYRAGKPYHEPPPKP